MHAAPRCKAKRKRDGKPCQGPAMANGCCRMHGGKSTGPKTVDGRERCRRKANWKSGHYSDEAKTQWLEARMARSALRAMLHATWHEAMTGGGVRDAGKRVSPSLRP